jgi:hypothetical protein
VPACALLSRLGASRLAGSHAALHPARPHRHLPCSCCRLSAAGVHLRPPVPWCRATGHQPTLPFGPSDGLASLLGSARWRLRPPSLPARRDGASLPPYLPGSLLHCSAAPCSYCRLPPCSAAPCRSAALAATAVLPQSIRLPGRCAAVPGASHPALRASGASLLNRLHCSPGSSALCDCVGYCICLLSLICLG